MCGIFGIILKNPDNVYSLVINGLIQLQNRGYDSAGLCVIKNNSFELHKYASTDKMNAIDKLANLGLVSEESLFIGMGHNRWATHGIKSNANAHPHLSNNKNFVIVHNGIIENYNELKKFLISNGYTFFSQTDTEVIVNLIEYHYNELQSQNNTFDAIKLTIEKLHGTYGLIIQNLDEENKLYCVRNGSPLLIGQNEDRVIITSEQSGFCNMVNNYITLHNDDICVIEKTINNIKVTTKHTYLKNKVNNLTVDLTPEPYKHWTLKEINEQPIVVLNSINKGGRIQNISNVKLGGLEPYTDILKKTDHLIILGCGTSYFAGQYGAYFFKQLCEFDTVEVFDGAELNEYDIPKKGNTVFILISQSGETKDLHRCIEIAKNKNIHTIGVINVVDSLIAREVDCGIYCNAGKEVAVASTKAFTSQVVCLSMAAIWFAQINNLNQKKREKMISDLHNLSNDIKMTLDSSSQQIIELSNKFKYENMFLLGKGSDEYIAKEGSLKIKEISYIHSEGYSSSSLKHGPFALLDENFPVILFNLDQSHKSKTLNCYQEIISRNSRVILITNDYNAFNNYSCEIICIPENKSYCSLLGIIPIQLLAYHMSIIRGINPDKPKNLAKVVTVE
jgi:glucosamine--fructose-6-phosphate aminotransferase (isomerizing)